MDIPKVSILIPLYNAENYIAETINSALSQTWKNTEIIIVDDGSTDKSYTIAKSFESAKLKVYKQKHIGACAARNLAFKHSTGNYIQYLDADDLISPNKIELQLVYFRKFGDSIITSSKTLRFATEISKGKSTGEIVCRDYKDTLDYVVDTWKKNGYLGIHAWLFPRDIVTKIGKWDINLKRYQDGDFIIRALIEVSEIKFVTDCVVYYRDTPNSISKICMDEYEESKCYLISKVIERTLMISNSEKYHKAAITYLSNSIYRWYPKYPDLVKKGLATLQNTNNSINVKSKDKLFNELICFLGWKTMRRLELSYLKYNRLLIKIRQRIFRNH